MPRSGRSRASARRSPPRWQDFGIKVTLVEPTGYETDGNGASSVQATRLPFYDGLRARLAEIFGVIRRTRGNPQASGPAILQVVDAEKPPLRIFFGRRPARDHRGRVREAHRHLGEVERRLGGSTREEMA